MDRRFLWFLLPTVLQGVMGVTVMVPITTFYLDPADLGAFAIVTALTLPVTPLSSVGDGWVLSTYWHRTSAAERHHLLFTLFTANVLLKAAWVAVFWALAPVMLPRLVREYRPEYEWYFRLALLGLLAGTLWPSLSALMVIERAAVTHAVNESLQWSAAATTTVIGLSMLHWGILALFVSPVVGGLVSTFHGLWYAASKLSVRWSPYWLTQIMRSGLPAMPFSLIDVLTNSVDRFVIQRWLDLSALGIYAHSQSYRGMFITMTKAYSRTMTPAFLERFAPAATATDRHVEDTVSLWYLGVTAAGILVTLFAPDVIHVLTHGKFDRASELVPLWFLLVFAHSMGVPFTQYLLSVGQSWLMSWSSIVASLAGMALVVVSTWWFGVIGATAAAVSGVFGLHILRYVLARRFGCPYRVEPGLLGGVATVLAVYGVTRSIELPLSVKAALAALVLGVVVKGFASRRSLRDVLAAMASSK